MKQTQRRDLIKQSAIGTAGLTIGAMGFSAKSYAAIAGANEPLSFHDVKKARRAGVANF